jgi:carbonic anhydrase/acetyltransferase-like protein (isoleucine patch superfamily)
MVRPFNNILPAVPVSAYVDPSAQVIGDVVLGEQASVWMNAVLRGDVNAIRVGARSNVQDCAVLHGQRYLYSVTVGELCTIGHNATVHGCMLEDEVLIGINAVVRPVRSSRSGRSFLRARSSPEFRERSAAPSPTRTSR